jgi:uncharacterized membrane protein (UPF0127 family)
MKTLRIGNKVWSVHYAVDQADLLQGLSGLLSIPPYTGMLFDMGADTAGMTVNMQSMQFSLDIAFISSTGQVVDAAHGVAPKHNYTTSSTFRYFLEVNAGELPSTGVVNPTQVITPVVVPQSILDSDTVNAIFTLSLVMMFIAVVKRIAYETDPKTKKKRETVAGRKDTSDLTKKAADRSTNEAKMEKRKAAMIEEGKSIAAQAGVEFDHLDEDWRSIKRYWFRNKAGLTIVALDLVDLNGKLAALNRFK